MSTALIQTKRQLDCVLTNLITIRKEVDNNLIKLPHNDTAAYRKVLIKQILTQVEPLKQLACLPFGDLLINHWTTMVNTWVRHLANSHNDLSLSFCLGYVQTYHTALYVKHCIKTFENQQTSPPKA